MSRPAIAWLLTMVMPFQALTAVYLDVRGPAHFHLEHEDDDRDHARLHSHADGSIEHHPHAPGDPGVVTLDDDLPGTLALEEKASGWSSTMLAALPPASPSLLPQNRENGLAPPGDSRFRSRIEGCPERPPRVDPA